MFQIAGSLSACVHVAHKNLLKLLHESGVGYTGSVFVRSLAYADDIAQLCSGCKKYVTALEREFLVAFNASKSACMFVSRCKYCEA